MAGIDVIFDADARSRLLTGIETLASVVKVTFGPAGRLVIIEAPPGMPTVTRNGAAIAESIELQDQFANMGVQMLRDAAMKTRRAVGDGTTSAIVLAQAIILEGARAIAAGANPSQLKRGIDMAVEAAIIDLERNARKISSSEEIAQVGAMAAHGDREIGLLVARAIQAVGTEGVVTVVHVEPTTTQITVAEGTQIDRGFLSPYFMTNLDRGIAELEAPLILLHDGVLSDLASILPLLEAVSKTGSSLLIVADDVEGHALATLVVNKLRGGLKLAAVQAPGFGAGRKIMLEDIAVLTGGRVVSRDLGMKLQNIDLNLLGRAKRVRIDKDRTTIVAGAGKTADIEALVARIRLQFQTETSDRDRMKLLERIEKLAARLAVIRVGGATGAEINEKKNLLDEALLAARAAIQEGVLPGGGVALLRAANNLEDLTSDVADQLQGIQILREALSAPVRQIVNNAGADSSAVLQRLIDAPDSSFGWNARTDRFGDLYNDGVIDPLMVVRTSLANAAAVAGLIITTEAMVAIKKDPELGVHERTHAPRAYLDAIGTRNNWSQAGQ